MKTTTQTITPERAAALLAAAKEAVEAAARAGGEPPRNRAFQQSTAERYLRMMRAGQWVLSAQGIVLDEAGVLMDGQHRLWAVVQHGAPVAFRVTAGAPRAMFHVLDRGRQRNLADVLSSQGYTSAHTLAGALGLLALEDRGFSHAHHWTETGDGLALAAAHPGIVDSVGWVTGHPSMCRLLEPRLAAYTHYRAGCVSAPKRDAFFARLCDGDGICRGEPVYLLRERLLSDRARTRVERMLPMERLAMTIKAVNMHMTGREARSLTVRLGGPHPEPFPTWVDPDAGAAMAATGDDGRAVAAARREESRRLRQVFKRRAGAAGGAR